MGSRQTDRSTDPAPVLFFLSPFSQLSLFIYLFLPHHFFNRFVDMTSAVVVVGPFFLVKVWEWRDGEIKRLLIN